MPLLGGLCSSPRCPNPWAVGCCRSDACAPAQCCIPPAPSSSHLGPSRPSPTPTGNSSSQPPEKGEKKICVWARELILLKPEIAGSSGCSSPINFNPSPTVKDLDTCKSWEKWHVETSQFSPFRPHLEFNHHGFHWNWLLEGQLAHGFHQRCHMGRPSSDVGWWSGQRKDPWQWFLQAKIDSPLAFFPGSSFKYQSIPIELGVIGGISSKSTSSDSASSGLALVSTPSRCQKGSIQQWMSSSHQHSCQLQFNNTQCTSCSLPIKHLRSRPWYPPSEVTTDVWTKQQWIKSRCGTLELIAAKQHLNISWGSVQCLSRCPWDPFSPGADEKGVPFPSSWSSVARKFPLFKGKMVYICLYTEKE